MLGEMEAAQGARACPLGLFNAEFRPVAADLNYVKKVSNDRARGLLGLRPRTSEQAIIASAESTIAKSLVGN